MEESNGKQCQWKILTESTPNSRLLLSTDTQFTCIRHTKPKLHRGLSTFHLLYHVSLFCAYKCTHKLHAKQSPILSAQQLLIGHFSETLILVVRQKRLKEDLPGRLSWLLAVCGNREWWRFAIVCVQKLPSNSSAHQKQAPEVPWVGSEKLVKVTGARKQAPQGLYWGRSFTLQPESVASSKEVENTGTTNDSFWCTKQQAKLHFFNAFIGSNLMFLNSLVCAQYCCTNATLAEASNLVHHQEYKGRQYEHNAARLHPAKSKRNSNTS